VEQLVLPIDAYVLDTPQAGPIAVAEDRLIGACMARQGLGWVPLPADHAPRQWPNRGRYGLAEPEMARRYGYHQPSDPRSEARQAWVDARDGRLTPAQRTAAYGADGSGGCEAQAQRTLVRGVARVDFGALDRIAEDTYEASRRAPQVRRLFAQWETCMREQGFTYPADPMAANDDPRWDPDKPASPAEIATARADVACKERTSLVTVWWRTEVVLQKREISRRAPWFATVRTARARYLANVSSYAHGGPAGAPGG
jgi:hypothetical protein